MSDEEKAKQFDRLVALIREISIADDDGYNPRVLRCWSLTMPSYVVLRRVFDALQVSELEREAFVELSELLANAKNTTLSSIADELAGQAGLGVVVQGLIERIFVQLRFLRVPESEWLYWRARLWEERKRQSGGAGFFAGDAPGEIELSNCLGALCGHPEHEDHPDWRAS